MTGPPPSPNKGLTLFAAVATYAVRVPDREKEFGCSSEVEVRAALQEYERRNPGAGWAGVAVYELRPDANVGTARPLHNFLGYEGPAEIVQDLHAFAVRCAFDLDFAGTGPASWSGSYQADAEMPILGEGVLRLADGSRGRIVVTSARTGSATPHQGEFAGSGPPPRP